MSIGSGTDDTFPGNRPSALPTRSEKWNGWFARDNLTIELPMHGKVPNWRAWADFVRRAAEACLDPEEYGRLKADNKANMNLLHTKLPDLGKELSDALGGVAARFG